VCDEAVFQIAFLSVFLFMDCMCSLCVCWHCCLMVQCTGMRQKCKDKCGWQQMHCCKGHADCTGCTILLCMEALYSLHYCQVAVAIVAALFHSYISRLQCFEKSLSFYVECFVHLPLILCFTVVY
jgi:hypothetical protein